jgi:hypothetical protein
MLTKKPALGFDPMAGRGFLERIMLHVRSNHGPVRFERTTRGIRADCASDA